MPIIKSAIKRVKQSEKRREKNVITKRSLKTSTKELEAAIEAGDKKKMTSLLSEVYGAYDTSVKKNLIHKNKAARKKSYYSALVKNASTSTAKKTVTKKSPTAKKNTVK